MMKTPLKDIRVLDFSTLLPGPMVMHRHLQSS